ncbi:MAG: tRNA 5-methoxyuridine(34)/uridine 5-oxyacetic acid(34) synthase CmoB [Candidatus Zapsychrus exili]|nr:tRNA 5-methoxyuridine(34)/uridine 5-oxyacetic acid(34) synthase CmoB [Candidatus Zapsychrus exili]
MKTIGYDHIFDCMKTTRLSSVADELKTRADDIIKNSNNGDLPKWIDILDSLPEIKPSSIDLNTSSICIGKKQDCDDKQRENLKDLLMKFSPWRKGPFNLFGIEIDSEWRSDMKWDRLKNHIAPLKDKLVLDVGCGNGYHCLRAAANNPKLVLGADFTFSYIIQFYVLQHFAKQQNVGLLPLGIDDLPDDISAFDTVFCMGLLYHRRSPFDLLLKLKSLLRSKGELVLETLIIDGEDGDCLSPSNCYAKMSNVFFIPSAKTLEAWLKKRGFINIRLVDVSQTTSAEQRTTKWMGFESFSSFLDPENSNFTIEGYPAPKRAIFLANNS